jgi:hypothetical protein
MDRKKELKEQYKQMRTEMGIYIVRSQNSNKYLLEATQNMKGKINRTRFQLESGGHPVKQLQKDCKEKGPDNFTIEILERLEYDKDESKTDYSEELEIMRIIWEEKLKKENMEQYK